MKKKNYIALTSLLMFRIPEWFFFFFFFFFKYKFFVCFFLFFFPWLNFIVFFFQLIINQFYHWWYVWRFNAKWDAPLQWNSNIHILNSNIDCLSKCIKWLYLKLFCLSSFLLSAFSLQISTLFYLLIFSSECYTSPVGCFLFVFF